MRYKIAAALRWVADRVDKQGARWADMLRGIGDFIDTWHVVVANGLDWVASRLEGVEDE